jgi:phage shock protein PspC (stress-responsive transcriptional regulator)
METIKRIYRDPQNKMIGGVCTGLGNYFNVDYSVIRIIWLLLFLFAGLGFVAYIIAWIIIPEKPQV